MSTPLTPNEQAALQETLQVFLKRIDEFEDAVLLNAFKYTRSVKDWQAIEARKNQYKSSLVMLITHLTKSYYRGQSHE